MSDAFSEMGETHDYMRAYVHKRVILCDGRDLLTTWLPIISNFSKAVDVCDPDSS